MVRFRTQEILLAQLITKIENMKGEERQFLLANLEVLKHLDDSDFHGVMSLYNGLLKINGMSEVTAFATTIQIARKAARIS